jgi:hypothetical protein
MGVGLRGGIGRRRSSFIFEKRVFLKKKELSDFISWDLDLHKTANIVVPLPTHSFGFCSCVELI